MTEDTGDDTCIICTDEILQQSGDSKGLAQPICALRCGHVYHNNCFQSWIAQQVSRRCKDPGECPVCKKVTLCNQVRILDFEVVRVQCSAYAELEKVSEEEQAKMLEDLDRERMEAEVQLEEIEHELAGHDKTVKESKRARRETNQRIVAEEAALEKLKAELTQSVVDCATLQSELDCQAQRQFKTLPIPPLREDDPDLREERRKIRVLRPADRARQLHDALVSARDAEALSGGLVRERASAVQAAEADRARLTQEEAQLRRKVAELRGSGAAASKDPGALFGGEGLSQLTSQGGKALSRQPSSSSMAASSVTPSGIVRQLSRQLSTSSAKSAGGASAAGSSVSTAASKQTPKAPASAALPSTAGSGSGPAMPADEEDSQSYIYGGSKKRSASGAEKLLGALRGRGALGRGLAAAGRTGAGSAALSSRPVPVLRGPNPARPNAVKALFSGKVF